MAVSLSKRSMSYISTSTDVSRGRPFSCHCRVVLGDGTQSPDRVGTAGGSAVAGLSVAGGVIVAGSDWAHPSKMAIETANKQSRKEQIVMSGIIAPWLQLLPAPANLCNIAESARWPQTKESLWHRSC